MKGNVRRETVAPKPPGLALTKVGGEGAEWDAAGPVAIEQPDAVERWMGSLGVRANVVAPAALRDRLGKIGREWAERYEG